MKCRTDVRPNERFRADVQQAARDRPVHRLYLYAAVRKRLGSKVEQRGLRPVTGSGDDDSNVHPMTTVATETQRFILMPGTAGPLKLLYADRQLPRAVNALAER